MKALIYQGPKQLSYEEVADPEPAEDEKLIRVESVGICGSDMHAYLGHDERRPAPLVLGHEAAGTILKSEDTKEIGKRVTINPLVTCGTCKACQEGRENLCPYRQIISMPPREGAFAELLKMPTRNLVAIPDHISTEKAALAEPFACGWHAIRLAKKALFQPIDQVKVIIIGGGAIGVGAALSLKVAGCKEPLLIESNKRRLTYLNDQIKLKTLSPDQLAENEQFDLVIDAVGLGVTRQSASRLINPGGVIMHVGLGDNQPGLDTRRVTLQEITFIGTYTYTHNDFKETASAIFDGLFGPLDWLAIRPLSEGAAAFKEILNGATAAPKLILKP